jgi:hypothetical protein
MNEAGHMTIRDLKDVIIIEGRFSMTALELMA